MSLSRPPNHAKCFLINSAWVAIAVTAVRFFRSIAEINLVVAGISDPAAPEGPNLVKLAQGAPGEPKRSA